MKNKLVNVKARDDREEMLIGIVKAVEADKVYVMIGGDWIENLFNIQGHINLTRNPISGVWEQFPLMR